VIKEWQLPELVQLFPHLQRTSARPLRCSAPLRGQGRYVKETKEASGFADVTLVASPATEFVVRFRHQWPDEVSTPVADELDGAMLEGIMEASLRAEQPPWGCDLSSTAVEYRTGLTSALAVKIAAAMALQDLLGRSGWIGRLPPEPERA